MAMWFRRLTTAWQGDFPLEMLVTVTFEEFEGKTKMTLKHVGLPAGYPE